jgi:hypothetical protein
MGFLCPTIEDEIEEVTDREDLSVEDRQAILANNAKRFVNP